MRRSLLCGALEAGVTGMVERHFGTVVASVLVCAWLGCTDTGPNSTQSTVGMGGTTPGAGAGGASMQSAGTSAPVAGSAAPSAGSGAASPAGGSGAGSAGAGAGANGAGDSGGAGTSGAAGDPGGAGGVGGAAGGSGAGGVAGSAGMGGSGGAAGAPNVGQPCTREGQVRCIESGGQGRELCSGSFWVSATSCASDQVCSNASGSEGTCKQLAEICRGRFGQAVCDASGVMHLCDSEGGERRQEPCGSQALCQAGAARQTCASCEPREDFRCSGATLQRCNDDGSGYATYRTCDSAALCKADTGSCTARVCEPNRYACQGDQLRRCNADGSALDAGQACGAGLCDSANGRCLFCRPNSVFCGPNDGTVETCNASGTGSTGLGCSLRCLQNQCIACDPANVGEGCGECATRCTADYRCSRNPADIPYHKSCTRCNGGACAGFCDPLYDCQPLYVIKANVNGRYIAVDSTGRLVASATTSASATRFAMYAANTSSDVYLYAWAQQRFVTSDGAGASPLVANITTPGPNQRFYVFPETSTAESIWSYATGKYVSADNSGASPLIANRTSFGPWEEFTFEGVNTP